MRPQIWSGDVVLVVEDDPDLRSALTSSLEAQGYRTLEAANGVEALQVLRDQSVSLVLLDLTMPVMSGAEFRAAQLGDPQIAHIPVLVLSGGDTDAVLDVQADAYLKKPIDARFLIANVQRAIRSAEASRLARAERLATFGAIAGGMAHEINNPLAYVVANLQELTERVPELGPIERAAELLARAREALDGALRIRDLVGEMRALSGVGHDDPCAVEVLPAIERAIEQAGPTLADVGTLSRDGIQPVPPVWATEEGLTQVLAHLLSNAREALPEPATGSVHVTARAPDDSHVEIAVSDDGAGISDEIRERVFEPFFSTRPPGNNAGLGLSVAYALVRSWNGRLELSSASGRGTSVTLRLERAPKTASAPATRRPKRGSARRGRVLVVDDEPAVARALSRLLSTEHDVIVCYGGREALEILEKDATFDAVVSDVIMPEVGGADLHAEIARRHPGLERRMVFVTGAAYTEAARTFLAAVDNTCLGKPVDRGALLAAVLRQVQETQA